MPITLYKRVTNVATQNVSGDHLATAPDSVSFEAVSPEALSEGTLYYCDSPDKNTWSDYKGIPASVTQLCLLSNTISNPNALIEGIWALPKTIKQIDVLEGDGTKLSQRKQLSEDDPYVMLLNYIILRKNQGSDSLRDSETQALIALLAHVAGSDSEKKMTSEQVHSAINCLDGVYGYSQYKYYFRRQIRHQIADLEGYKAVGLVTALICVISSAPFLAPVGLALALGVTLANPAMTFFLITGLLPLIPAIIGLLIAVPFHMKAAGMEKVLQQVEQDKGNSSSTSLLLNAMQRADNDDDNPIPPGMRDNAIQRSDSLNNDDNDDNNPIPPGMKGNEVEPENKEDAPTLQIRQGTTYSLFGDGLGSQPEPSAPPVSMDDENFKLQ